MYAALSEQRAPVIESIKNRGVSSGRNDVILHKTAVIERGLNRIHEVYEGNRENLTDYTKQDSIILNIQRACEASIDLAMHVVSERKLGVPKASREAFRFLQEANLIEEDLASSLMNMVGFRNIAVHDYQKLDLDILEAILEKHIENFRSFSKIILYM
ncbi:type VII toxin-antitoxin system HepT family RNase toxin [Sporosarcina jeotgali]|uniref:type VII toxin-antitoxin system HepT family RNase toxin n=1 Tax=Sporosarcina jeotgali TaxID=3020056 RepID=UPI003D6655FD